MDGTKTSYSYLQILHAAIVAHEAGKIDYDEHGELNSLAGRVNQLDRFELQRFCQLIRKIGKAKPV